MPSVATKVRVTEMLILKKSKQMNCKVKTLEMDDHIFCSNLATTHR